MEIFLLTTPSREQDKGLHAKYPSSAWQKVPGPANSDW